jgi:hypothetical protein
MKQLSEATVMQLDRHAEHLLDALLPTNSASERRRNE